MIKLVRSVALVLLVLVPELAFAECRCQQPLPPELPPNRPTAAEMSITNGEVSAYAEAMKKYRECLVKCLRGAESDLSHVVSEWNEMVEKFNRVQDE